MAIYKVERSQIVARDERTNPPKRYMVCEALGAITTLGTSESHDWQGLLDLASAHTDVTAKILVANLARSVGASQERQTLFLLTRQERLYNPRPLTELIADNPSGVELAGERFDTVVHNIGLLANAGSGVQGMTLALAEITGGQVAE